jgi:two-component sensor histidine kinase
VSRDEAEQVVRNDQKVIASGQSMQFVERFTTDKGQRILLSTKSPFFDEDGNIVGTIGVSTDITEREERARHVEFIMRELSHRSKNLLSVIIAIARQSVRQSESMEDFGLRFNERLIALARLHDILVQEQWRGASLHTIAQSQIAPFAGNRVSFNGPTIHVRPDVAQVLCMIFHELATNAAKYGALSTNEGSVSLTWNVLTDGRKRLSIQWQELKGPPVLPPQRKGFGSIVVERMALQISDASASLTYVAAGVIWYLEAPLDSFVFPASSEFGDPADGSQGLANFVGVERGGPIVA